MPPMVQKDDGDDAVDVLSFIFFRFVRCVSMLNDRVANKRLVSIFGYFCTYLSGK